MYLFSELYSLMYVCVCIHSFIMFVFGRPDKMFDFVENEEDAKCVNMAVPTLAHPPLSRFSDPCRQGSPRACRTPVPAGISVKYCSSAHLRMQSFIAT